MDWPPCWLGGVAMMVRAVLLGVLLLSLVSCEKPERVGALEGLPELGVGRVAPRVGGDGRVNGRLGSPDASRPPVISMADPAQVVVGGEARGGAAQSGPGEFSFDFADADIREVTAQILGEILRVNYTIDPNLRGTVTLRTVRPLSRAELLPALQSLLAQVNAGVTQSGMLYRVGPVAAGAAAAGGAGGGGAGIVVPLRYAGAEDLAKVLQPYVGAGGKVVADAGRNALLVSAEGEGREALLAVIQAFDTDILARQSYALLPVSTGGVKDFATALQEAFRGQGGALAGVVRVVPMERISAVLIVSTQRDYISAARRIYDTLETGRRQTIHSWYVHYLQNGQANDVANLLQQAFTPNNVTAVAGNRSTAGGGALRGAGGGMGSTMSSGGMGSGGMGGGGSPGGGAVAGMGAGGGGFGTAGGGAAGGGFGNGTAGGAGIAGGVSAQAGGAGAVAANPLLGGLDVLGLGGAGGPAAGDGMRIVANETNNALLIYATPAEYDTVQAMLRRIDILPLQVRIDATIAEVVLNDSLKYGTQFYFRSGGMNGLLNFGTGPLGLPSAVTPAVGLPGFVLGGPGQGGAPMAISALQGITEVKVLSSPQLLVLDNQSAKLQVGSMVPYLSQTSQSTISPGAPVINSVNYQQTGVIMQITPRVNSGGLVTLDISQEVSEVDNSASQTASGINSPTFQNRNVVSRVVVQDGQTIGLAGLIRDSASTGNDGIPFLKDVPLLGLFAGRQNNERVRTELIVLITPHVMHDQRDARMLTQDLREQLSNAARVPEQARDTQTSGSADPQKRLRRAIRSLP